MLTSRISIAGVAILLPLMISACGLRDQPRSASNTPARSAPAGRADAPLLTGSTSTSVWQLRSGLNVAALTCRGRGRASVEGEYRKLLSRHQALLASAYSEEERRLGKTGFDRQQTRVYNRYSNQRSPERFCAAAVEIARSANRMDSARLAPAARGMVSDLDHRLR